MPFPWELNSEYPYHHETYPDQRCQPSDLVRPEEPLPPVTE